MSPLRPQDAYVPATRSSRIGHITPSSNSVLEPMVALLNQSSGAPVSHHFSRITVETISLADEHLAQFSQDRMLYATSLLADARMHAIVWNGTSGSRSGLETDRELCRSIRAHTGVPASTSSLAIVDALAEAGLTKYGLAVPYLPDVAERIVDVYGQAGLDCRGVSTAGITDNRLMAFLEPDDIRRLLRDADSPDAECLLVVCTGVAGAPLVEEMEQELGKPIIDSVSATYWQALRMVDEPCAVDGWGALLDGSLLAATSTAA